MIDSNRIRTIGIQFEVDMVSLGAVQGEVDLDSISFQA